MILSFFVMLFDITKCISIWFLWQHERRCDFGKPLLGLRLFRCAESNGKNRIRGVRYDYYASMILRCLPFQMHIQSAGTHVDNALNTERNHFTSVGYCINCIRSFCTNEAHSGDQCNQQEVCPLIIFFLFWFKCSVLCNVANS